VKFRDAIGATVVDRLCDNFFCASVPIHFRGVDEAHTEVEPESKRRDFRRAPASVFPCRSPRKAVSFLNARADRRRRTDRSEASRLGALDTLLV